MAAGLLRFGVVTSAPGSVSGGRAGKLKPDRFPLPALPPQPEVWVATADSLLLAVACLISYWLTARVLSLVYSVSPGDDALGGLWAVIATVFLFRASYDKSMAAAVSRMAATLASFVLCLTYLAFRPFHPWGLALLVGLSVLVTAVIGRPEDEITAGITTTVVMVSAQLSPHDAWRQPIFGWPTPRSASQWAWWPRGSACAPSAPRAAAGVAVMSATRLAGGVGLAPSQANNRTTH